MKVKVAQLCPTVCNPMDSPRNSLGQNTEVGSLSLLQGIFPTQELNQGLLYCRWILYQLSYQGSPTFKMVHIKKKKILKKKELQVKMIIGYVSCSVKSDSLWLQGCSPPGSSVLGILQAKILEWVAIPFFRGSCWPRGWTQVFCIVGRFFTIKDDN